MILGTWRADPVALIAIVAAASLYARGARRVDWPISRSLLFTAGLLAFGWVQCGFLGAYSSELRWAFSTRIALLLFAVPSLIATGRPLALARAALGEAGARRLESVVRSAPVRFVGNAMFATLFAAALLTLLLTPLAALARTTPGIEEALTLFLPLSGLAMVLPMAEDTAQRTGLFITVEFLLAFAELVLDAVPGILLRINDTLFDAGVATAPAPGWLPSPLSDQHLSGDLLWFIAEIADVPVLILLFVRWLRSDARDAHEMDALSDHEMDALTAEHLGQHPSTPGTRDFHAQE